MVNKIGLFLPSLDGGGAEKIMLNISREMANTGMDVDLIVAKNHGAYINHVPHNVNLIDLKCNRMLKSFFKLFKYIKKHRPTAVLTTLESASLIGILANLLTGKKTKLWVRVPNYLSIHATNSDKRIDKLRPTLARILYKHADGIIAISKGVAKDIANITKINLDDIKVVYNPVSSPGLIKKGSEPTNHKWLEEKSKPVVLAVGRLTKQKNFSLLIRAFKVVQESIEARLVIIGDGEERSKLEDLINNLEISNAVDMPGFKDNPYSYMSKSDLFVLSSKWEGFGNVIVESLALGTPVVSTNCPSGPSEILNHGEYGTLVNDYNTDTLAMEIIKNLKQDLYSKEELVKRSLSFSSKEITEQYIKLMLGEKYNDKE
ncbi:glycosyltransferase [Halobacillus sp. Cin3]|uniref:glycosyltransferase n=1 Tax=Halobacillus sp. Cin3 TaxID=2928441 RepID=UPI00248EF75F|nr:glycosyltransferase [Halobacillus sp. Cin3]